MIERRPFASLGGFRNDWLNARHHFSFGHYHDPARMGLGRLRVWNDDEIAPGTGFDPHPHREMEIITYIREGAITHQDSLGNVGRTEAGDIQVMHAGSGIVHAEYNQETITTRLFQIWILPDRPAAAPGWETRLFPRSGSGLDLLASGRPQDTGTGALGLYADAALHAGTLTSGQAVDLALAPDRAVYLVPVRGEVVVNNIAIGPRDGAAIAQEHHLHIVATTETELVLVDVAG